MSIFHPHYAFRRIYEIPAAFFSERGIGVLLIDVDNTLTTNNNPTPHDSVLSWLEGQQEQGIRLVAFSNNSEARVCPFAKRLGLGFVAGAGKPLPGNVKKALGEMGCGLNEAAIVGDQLFTDVLCGRLVGCLTVLVEPMAPESSSFFRVKRLFEKGILRRFRRKQQRQGQRRAL